MIDAKAMNTEISLPEMSDIEEIQRQIDTLPNISLHKTKTFKITSSGADLFGGTSGNFMNLTLSVDETGVNQLNIMAGQGGLYFRYSTDSGSTWTNIWSIRKDS